MTYSSGQGPPHLERELLKTPVAVAIWDLVWLEDRFDIYDYAPFAEGREEFFQGHL